MKKTMLAFLLIMIGSFGAKAQMSKDSLVKKLAQEVCIDLEKKDFSKIKKSQLEEELGLALLPAITKYENEIKEVYKVDEVMEAKTMETVGRDIGMKLVSVCPSFLKIFAKGLAEDDEKDTATKVTEEEVAKVEVKSVFGMLMSITQNQVAILQVKDRTGKITKIIWLEQFVGSDLLQANAAKFLNKPVTIKFTEREVYNATTKKYTKMKVAYAISLD
jgi:hypothetical protein